MLSVAIFLWAFFTSLNTNDFQISSVQNLPRETSCNNRQIRVSVSLNSPMPFIFPTNNKGTRLCENERCCVSWSLNFYSGPWVALKRQRCSELFLRYRCCIWIAKGRWYFEKFKSIEQWDAATKEPKICILQYSGRRCPKRRVNRCQQRDHNVTQRSEFSSLPVASGEENDLFRVTVMIVSFKTSSFSVENGNKATAKSKCKDHCR